MAKPLAVEAIVEAGLCIGCGLCRSLAGPDRIRLVDVAPGRERPVVTGRLDQETLVRINAVCPGTRIDGADPATIPAAAGTDVMWGPAAALAIAHAGDPDVRFRAATGGVLTALGQYLLRSGRVERVLHVRPDPRRPLRTVAWVSDSAEAVLTGMGSRYGPGAPLVGLMDLVADGRPLAVIAKPCDIGAVRRLMAEHPPAAATIRATLAMVCGGASDLGKSRAVLAGFRIPEAAVTLFRYRGHGNPGPLRVEADDGRSHEVSYTDLWEDQTGWALQPRCKLCPDAIGEAADLVAADCWPGGSPTGEDAGFNAVLARTATGLDLYRQAVAAGALIEDRAIGFRDLDSFQPHQVRRKQAVLARFRGMADAGLPTPAVRGLRLDAVAAGVDPSVLEAERAGAFRRAQAGRLGEPPVPADAVDAVPTA